MPITGLVSVDGFWLDDNLHLMGSETSPPINYSIRTTLGGNKVIQTHPRSAGASLRLIARNDGTSRMGQFCSSHIDHLRALAGTGADFILIHHGRTFTVKILEFNLEQSDEREAPGPNKKWHGEIHLEEV